MNLEFDRADFLDRVRRVGAPDAVADAAATATMPVVDAWRSSPGDGPSTAAAALEVAADLRDQPDGGRPGA